VKLYMDFKKHRMRTGTILLPLVLVMSLVAACGGKKEIVLAGRTMGTTYHVKAVVGRFYDEAGLRVKIEKRLAEINHSMSTYQPDSEISRFNRLGQAGVPFPISNDFLAVMQVARRVHALTQGAWDGTVKPLVDLWGFGKSAAVRVPSSTEITSALSRIGFEHIEISEAGSLIKRQDGVTLDLASIAKGYGVDQIARVLSQDGVTHYLVEIGGEVVASGNRLDGEKWKVGINEPQSAAAYNAVYKVLKLHDQALATSGDYRNFFEMDGKRYSHVIDPRNGYPVSNGVISVSVIADNCILADGLATAIMVIGPKGVAVIDRLENVEGLIVVQTAGGTVQEYASKGCAGNLL